MLDSTSSRLHRVAIATLLALWVGAGSALAFQPTDQARSVHGFVIVPHCAQQAFDDEEAEGFGPFVARAVATVGCPVASASATGDQRSRISQSALIARGRAVSNAAADHQGVIHAIAASHYSVTFDVATLTPYTLRGRISAGASAENVFVFAVASVRLVDAAGQPLADYEVEPGDEGAQQTVIIDQSGVLEPGEHTLTTESSTVIDNYVPPNGSVQANFELVFRTPGETP